MFLKRCHTWKELDLDWQKVGTRRGLIHFITNFWLMTQGVTDVLFYLKIVVFSKNMSNETVKHKICIRKAWFFQRLEALPLKSIVLLSLFQRWHSGTLCPLITPLLTLCDGPLLHPETTQLVICIITVFRFTFFFLPSHYFTSCFLYFRQLRLSSFLRAC